MAYDAVELFGKFKLEVMDENDDVNAQLLDRAQGVQEADTAEKDELDSTDEDIQLLNIDNGVLKVVKDEL